MARSVAAMLFAIGAAAAADEGQPFTPATPPPFRSQEIRAEEPNLTLEDASGNASGIVLDRNETDAEEMTLTMIPPLEKMAPRNTTLVAAALDAEAHAASASLSTTWEDCGSNSKGYFPTAATITSFSPERLFLGKTTTIKGSGDLQIDVQGGTVETVTSAGFIRMTESADLCEPKTSEMPLGAGKMTWRGMNCPVRAGPVDMLTDVQLASYIPWVLRRATVTIRGTSSEGFPLFCMKVKLSPGRRLAAASSAVEEAAEEVAEDQPAILV